MNRIVGNQCIYQSKFLPRRESELIGKLNANDLPVLIVPWQKGFATVYLNITSTEFIEQNSL